MNSITPAYPDSDGAALLDQVGGVERLEAMLLALPQLDLQTVHVLSGGVCARCNLIPADTFLTGARSNKDHINVVFGDITVTTPDGPVRLTGFNVFPAKAGHKRAGHAHADTHWLTIWKTDLSQGEEIEDEMTAESAQLLTRRLRLPAHQRTVLDSLQNAKGA